MSLFLFHISAPHGPIKIWPILVQGWALTYEVIFYLVFTIALFARRENWLTIMAGVFIGLVLLGIVWRPQGAFGITITDPVLLEFLGGALFGQAWLKGWRLSARASWILLALSLIGLAGGTWAAQIFEPLRAAFLGIPALMIVIACVMLDYHRPWQKRPWVHEIGQASYSIYLVHGLVISVVARLFVLLKLADGSTGMGLVFIATCGIAATLAGIVSWRWLEKPLADWFKVALAPRTMTVRGGAAAD